MDITKRRLQDTVLTFANVIFSIVIYLIKVLANKIKKKKGRLKPRNRIPQLTNGPQHAV